MERRLFQNITQQTQLGRLIKLSALLLLTSILLGCAGIMIPARRGHNAVLLRERSTYVDYALAYLAYRQEDYENSLEISMALRDYQELHPYIGRLIIRNRIALQQWDKIENDLGLLGQGYEDIFLKGKYYFEIEDYESARSYFVRLAAYPNGARAVDVNRMLLDIYREFKEWGNFSDTALSLLTLPGRREQFFRAALFTLFEHQQPQEAADFVHQALRYVSLDEDSLLFYVLLTVRFFEEEQVPDLAEYFLQNIVDQYSGVLDLYLDYSIRTYESEDPELIEDRLLLYLEDYPEKVIPHFIRFLISAGRTTQLQDLIEEYKSYIEQQEELVKIIGVYFFNREDYVRAQHYFELSVEMSEPDSQMIMLLLSSKLETGNISPVRDVELALKNISLSPTDLNGYYLLSRLFRFLPEEERAPLRQQYVDKKIETLDYYRYGVSLFMTDELYSPALDFVRKGLEKYPGEEPLLVEKSFILYRKGNLDRAEEIYLSLLEKETNNPFVYNNLAYLWAEMEKNLTEALEYAYKSLEMAPEEPSILDTVGWIHFLKENYDEAEYYLEQAGDRMLEYYEEGLYSAQEIKEVIEHLIMLYETTGDEEKLDRWFEIHSEISDIE